MDTTKVEKGLKYFINKGLENDTLLNDIFTNLQKFIFHVIIAIIVFWVLKYIVRWILSGMNVVMEKKGVDLAVRNFFLKTIRVLFQIITVVIIIGILGFNTTSLVAMLGTMGLAVGLALQGTLQNFAGGVIVLIFKPFVLGDEIESSVGDFRGIVKDISIFTTTLVTFDNISIIIPNSELATKTLTNYSKQGERRIDEVIGIDYGDSVDKAREIILDVVNSDERVLKSRDISVVVASLSDSSVDLKILAWTESKDYYGVKSYVREEVHKRFAEQGITIPFPQLTVHS